MAWETFGFARAFIKHAPSASVYSTSTQKPNFSKPIYVYLQGLNNTNQLANGQPGLYQQQSSTLSSNIIRVTSGQIVEIYMNQQFEGIWI